MSYFRVNDEEHFEMYEGDKKLENGVYLVSTTAKKTLARRLAFFKKKLATCTPEEEAAMQYQKQIDYFAKLVKDKGLSKEEADRMAP